MKKRNIELFLSVLIVAVALIILANIKQDVFLKSNYKIIDEYKSVNDIVLTEIKKQDQLNILKASLKNEFGSDYIKKIEKNSESLNLVKTIESFFEKNDLGQTIYPNDFGGMYIDENDELIIQLTEDNVKSTSLLQKINYNKLNITENNIEYVNNSYNELNYVNNEIINYFTNNTPYSNFLGNYVDVINNKVVVELKNISLESQQYFKDYVIDSDFIEFKIGNEVSPASTYKAGSGIDITYTMRRNNPNGGYTQNNVTGYCSIGARTKLNGVIGYITAGHCFGNMDYDIIQSTVNNGEFVKRKYNQTMDAAFVKLGSGHSLSNNLAYTGWQASSINTTTGFVGQNQLVVGATVGKVGKATGYGYGSVVSMNYSYTEKNKINNENYYHSGYVRANIGIAEGDSGGPVFLLNNSIISSGAPLVGIISSGNNTITLFYKYDDIVSQLGLTKY